MGIAQEKLRKHSSKQMVPVEGHELLVEVSLIEIGEGDVPVRKRSRQRRLRSVERERPEMVEQ